MRPVLHDVMQGPARVQVRRPGSWKTLWFPRWQTVTAGRITSIVHDSDEIVTRTFAWPGKSVDVRASTERWS